MKRKDSFYIDKYINNDIDFWKELEVYCVAECCGIDAFDFSKEAVEKVSKFYNSKKISKNILELISILELSSKKYLSSDFFNIYIEKNIFIKELRKIKSTMK